MPLQVSLRRQRNIGIQRQQHNFSLIAATKLFKKSVDVSWLQFCEHHGETCFDLSSDQDIGSSEFHAVQLPTINCWPCGASIFMRVSG